MKYISIFLALSFFFLPAVNLGATLNPGKKVSSRRKPETTPGPVIPESGSSAPAPRPTRQPSTKDLEQGVHFLDPDFEGDPISMELNGVDLYEFLEFFNTNFGLNYVIDESVPKTSISIRVSLQPWNQIVHSVLQAKRLTVRSGKKGKGIFRVMSLKASSEEEEDIRKERETVALNQTRVQKIYRLKNRSVSTGAFIRAGGGAADTSATTTGGTTASTDGSGFQGSGLKIIIQNLLTKIGKVEEDRETNSFIIDDTPAAHERVAKILEELDRPEPIIEVEARLVVARRDYSRNLGVILNVGANSNGFGIQGGTAPNPIAGVSPAGGRGTVPGAQPNGSLGLGSAASSVLGFSLSRGTYNLQAAINAMETKGVARTILAPRTRVINNMTATLGNGVDIPYVQASPVGGGQGGVGVAQTTTFANASLGFNVTPQIAGDEIVLKIDIRNDSPSGSAVNGLPLITRQQASTTVRCLDGGTILISGLLSDQESNNLNRVPGLANLPGIGKLFERKDKLHSEVELLFFVTARVVRPGEEEIIVERPQGIDVPNTPEQPLRPLPPIDAPKPDAKRKEIEKVKTPAPAVLNPEAKRTGEVVVPPAKKKEGDE
jgi:type IV pilus assembly protein PilQ